MQVKQLVKIFYKKGLIGHLFSELNTLIKAMNTADEFELPVPRKYLYDNDDAQINGTNYDAASSAMNGDELDIRVFWDINVVGN